MNEEQIIVWEAPVLEKPEFRLYYDIDSGNVLCYTCNKLDEGSFIVVDALAYAEARIDIKVIDGLVTKTTGNATLSKLVPSEIGQACAFEDISIIVSKEDKIKTKRWEYVIRDL